MEMDVKRDDVKEREKMIEYSEGEKEEGIWGEKKKKKQKRA